MLHCTMHHFFPWHASFHPYLRTILMEMTENGPFSPLLPPFPQFFRNLSDTPIGQGGGIVWEGGGEVVVVSVLLQIFFENDSHLDP